MANDVNYKTKYQELKLKFINSVDTAFRLGYEQGIQASQLQNAQSQLQQAQGHAQSMAQMASAQQQPGEEQAPEAPVSEHPEGSELDQHIAELEGLLGKSEISFDDIKKSIDSLKAAKLRKTMHPTPAELKKTMGKLSLAKNEVKSVHVPNLESLSQNLDPASKDAIKMQNDIVKNVMAKWQDEERRMANDISNTLSLEGLTHKE